VSASFETFDYVVMCTALGGELFAFGKWGRAVVEKDRNGDRRWIVGAGSNENDSSIEIDGHFEGSSAGRMLDPCIKEVVAVVGEPLDQKW